MGNMAGGLANMRAQQMVNHGAFLCGDFTKMLLPCGIMQE
jgi:hypothetical protein